MGQGKSRAMRPGPPENCARHLRGQMAQVSVDAPLLVKRLQALATLLTVGMLPNHLCPGGRLQYSLSLLTMQEQNARFAGSASLAFLHGKHQETGMAVEPYAVSMQASRSPLVQCIDRVATPSRCGSYLVAALPLWLRVS